MVHSPPPASQKGREKVVVVVVNSSESIKKRCSTKLIGGKSGKELHIIEKQTG